MQIYKMIVRKMSFEKTRVLLFGDDPGFYVIALFSQINGMKIGDEIEYEPKTVNFGWIVKPKDSTGDPKVIIDDGDSKQCLYTEFQDKDESVSVPVKKAKNALQRQINKSALLNIERKRNSKQ